MGVLYRPGPALSAKPLGIEPESFGRRVAKLRAELGWTQQRLADRVGMSRVALSHVEAHLSTPSQRTVTLLAGVFGREPHELVDGTDYPAAKAERLPLVAARHTEVEHQLGVLAAVLDLLERLPATSAGMGPAGLAGLAADVRSEWRGRLTELLDRTAEVDERRRLRAALHGLATGRP